jgi:hypothetical protein
MSNIDRRRYTEPELFDLAEAGQLPGFMSEASFGPELFEGTAWQPVLNLAIINFFDGEPHSPEANLGILTAIRTETGNETHPNVVSTPTRRLTREQAQALIREKDSLRQPTSPETFQLTQINPGNPALAATYQPHLRVLGDSSILPSLAHELLTEKLGLKTLELKSQKVWEGLGKISLSKVIAGFSHATDRDTGQAEYEPILMIGSVLSSGRLPLQLASETKDYRNVSWTPVADFAENVRERNVANLVVASQWDEVYACVRGLCLVTSVEATTDTEDLWQHMGYSDNTGFRRYYDPAVGAQVLCLM